MKLPEPTAAEICLARRLVREGATMVEIHARLGWDCSKRTTKYRLARCGVNTSGWRAHRGERTSLPDDYRRRGGA